MPLSVAIVGSGPSGFYTAEALLKSGADCRIDIIDRLAAPYGLIRGGVAPDHQSTKRVSKAFERTALKDEVRFFGNVEVGRDLSLAELHEIYDAVVLAVGAPVDRPMGVPGDQKRGVFGAAAFVGWYNGEPDHRNLSPNLDIAAAAVVGNGNVALDIARVLVKTPQEMATTDLVPQAAAAIHTSPLRDVYLLGRRGPVEAKFSNVELREMGELQDCQPVVMAEILPDAVVGEMSDRDRRLKEKNLATFRSFTEQQNGRSKRVHFCFHAAPSEILGEDRVTGLKVERTKVVDGRAVGTGEFFTLDCGLVVQCHRIRRPADRGNSHRSEAWHCRTRKRQSCRRDLCGGLDQARPDRSHWNQQTGWRRCGEGHHAGCPGGKEARPTGTRIGSAPARRALGHVFRLADHRKGGNRQRATGRAASQIRFGRGHVGPVEQLKPKFFIETQ